VKAEFILALILSVAFATPGWSQKVNPDAALIQDFQARVKDYVKLQKQEEAGLRALKPTASPEAIGHHEHELAERIRKVRHGIAQGSIFTPQIAAEFHRLIAMAMQGTDAGHVDQSLQHAEPAKLPLRIGERYPVPGVPLQSTPPTLLQNLPPLPPELDYRIVDRALILRDAKANLIVDFAPNMMP
jgi:hypothetical protein